MGSAFWFLMRRSARNRLIRQMNRLKEPRYALALAVGGAYLWFFLFGRAAPAGTPDPRLSAAVPLLGALVLFLAVGRWWAFGGDRRALSFTPAEIQFLFPAPIERKALIHWKLLRWQLLILLNTFIWMLIAGRTRPPIPGILYFISLWVLFSTLSLHRLGSALTKAGIATHWRTGLRRQLIPLAVIIVAAVSLLSVIAGHWSALSDACCGSRFLPVLQTTLSSPGAATVLYPFLLLTAPLGAATVLDWVRMSGPALALLMLHYFWVMRSQVTFEDAALKASADSLARVARPRGERTSVPRKAGRTLPLGSRGWPGTAIVWKNIIAITRGSLARSALIAFMIMGAALASVLGSSHRSSAAVALGTTTLAIAALLGVLGPSWIRNDLRGDLAYLGLLRSYPLRGRTIVLAEIMASMLVLSALQLMLASVAYVALTGSLEWNRYLSLELSFAVGIPVVLLVNAIGLTIQNAGALMFPAWVRFDQLRPGGFDTLGQNILSMLFTFMLTALALAAPAALGWAIWAVLRGTMGWWSLLPASVGAVIVGVLELSGLIVWLGRVFDRTESTV